ncbi:MAG: trypsin-like serine protease [Burkholderiaceae bacterium]|nr:trypsin-like serine protease [Burkholderiaceae bacterium]
MKSIKTVGARLRQGLLVAALVLSGNMAAATERVVLGDANLRTALQELRTAAAKTGEVRVIVGVRTPFAPEGKLAAEAVGQQRREIASAQAAVLAQLPQVAQKKNALRRFETIPFMAMVVNSADLAALEQMPEVASVQRDKPNRPTLSSSVPQIGGSTAWSSGYTGTGQTVAVLDTGVDKTHPFLTGKVVSEACYSTTLVSDKSYSVCPGGVAQSTAAGSGMPCAVDCDHGTHVAGIVAGNNGPQGALAGVAKSASLIAIQVFSEIRDPNYCQSSTSCPTAYDADIVSGLERVLALSSSYSIAAANMSLGGSRYYSQSTCDAENLSTKAAIDNLRAAGIATVISSGNDGYTNSMGSPGCISSAISVGSTYARSGFSNNCDGNNLGTSSVDSISCYSNSASFLNLLAPGSAINSSIPGNAYDEYWGTSMAAPHVAGAWALLKQKQPSASVTEVLNAFVSTGQAITDPRNSLTKPRINVAQALNALGGSSSFLLAVSKAGTGAGSITSSPSGIDCGSDCSESYANGTSVTLTATPASTSTFTGWSGACTGTASTCTVTMSAARSVTASFTNAIVSTRLVALTKSGTGTGTVSSSPSGINCAASCSSALVSFSSTASVVLTATPSSGSSFAGWSGACTGTGTCTVAAGTSSASVGAAFNTSSTGGGSTVTLLDRTGLSGAAGSAQRFSVQVPSGATNLVISTSGGTGDVDLYVKAGTAPTTTSFDCESYQDGNTENCSFATPTPGTYHILLDGYTAYSGVALKATYTGTSAAKVTLTVQKTGSGQGTVVSTSATPGLAQNLSAPQIVGGQLAAAGAWPWQVRLRITTASGTFLCGGSLLSDRWVLTAAHCVVGDDEITTLAPSAITVRAGSLQKDSGGQVVNVTRIVRHASYSPVTTDNDMALLELFSPVTLSSTANVVPPLLASQEATLAATNTLATVTGWGTTSSGGSTSSALMQVQVPLLTSSACASQSAYGSAKITNNMICAGYPAGGKDSCQGDSGGPLVVPDGRGGYVLAGIVSWGQGCALPNYPGVYTRVANYQAWLEANTGLTFGTTPTTPTLIDCGSTCSATVDLQTTITLKATATSGSTFVGWGGACTGTASTCTVTMGASKSVTASFNAGSTSGPLPNATDFVAQQYRDFLGREADAAGLNSWVSQLNAGTVSRAQMVQSLMGSSESKNRYGPLVRLYTAYFLRQPDYAGLMYWLGQMFPSSGATGTSLAQVSGAFAQSAEFVNRYGSLSNDGFVNLVYQNVLGRQPDAAGKAYWLGQLNGGLSRGSLMIGFSESTENQGLTTNAVQITTGYVGMLRRAPSTTDHAYWLAEIAAGRSTVLVFIDWILKSTEYAQRF